MLRDETESVSRKVQRGKRRGLKAPRTAGQASGQQGTIGTIAPSSAIATTASSGLFLPKSFQDAPEQQAVNSFFSTYIVIHRHPYSRRGYLDCLLPLYQITRHDSLLSLATTAIALAVQGGSPKTRHYRDISPSYFGKALQKTSRAIRDPVESVKDETLMAVLLLSFYEVRISLPHLYITCAASCCCSSHLSCLFLVENTA